MTPTRKVRPPSDVAALDDDARAELLSCLECTAARPSLPVEVALNMTTGAED